MLANDLYHQLTQEGLKVFFSRITLEDKIGEAYEPYIFAALNSAKVMVVLGTRPEYFKAVWVRNEWSRFLSQIKAGAKKSLVPAYKDMDPYDLPDEFSNLQAQDMSKLGFMQDLIRGIKKLTEKEEPKPVVVKETKVVTNVVNNGAEQLMKRARLALEDGEFYNASDFCEQVLNIDAENAEAYLIKLLAEFNVNSIEKLGKQKTPFDESKNYMKVMRFADETTKEQLNKSLDACIILKNKEVQDSACIGSCCSLVIIIPIVNGIVAGSLDDNGRFIVIFIVFICFFFILYNINKYKKK